MQHEKANIIECSGVYSTNCKDCEQKYIGETGRTMSTRIEENQRLCRKMDTERSEAAEHIALICHTLGWDATERLDSYGENIRKRKIREAVGILSQRNLMNRRLEIGRVNDNFVYRLGRTRDSAKTSKRRRLESRQLFNNMKLHRQGTTHEGRREVEER
ncbi:unnamed protein product [Protopolystoma xenopodis]|uniref:Uncharacterized protein n=1 Tax=Protopolystoma xenopodis TaxID=117903 RepID=A0A3S4ZYU9_9PLAT|nr:unnamed protein product [Protopolystoma xenopodis]